MKYVWQAERVSIWTETKIWICDGQKVEKIKYRIGRCMKVKRISFWKRNILPFRNRKMGPESQIGLRDEERRGNRRKTFAQRKIDWKNKWKRKPWFNYKKRQYFLHRKWKLCMIRFFTHCLSFFGNENAFILLEYFSIVLPLFRKSLLCKLVALFDEPFIGW